MESMATISASRRGASSRASRLLPQPVGPVRISAWRKTSGSMRSITDHRPELAKTSHADLPDDPALPVLAREGLRVLPPAEERPRRRPTGTDADTGRGARATGGRDEARDARPALGDLDGRR